MTALSFSRFAPAAALALLGTTAHAHSSVEPPVDDAARPIADEASESLTRERRDPLIWRDRRKPDLRKYWDTLEGRQAPALGGLAEWLNTDARSWQDLAGKVVLIDYWATWCGPCRVAIPHLSELQEKYRDRGLVILGVHSSRDWQKMAGFVKKSKLKYAFAADKDRELGTALGVKFLPTYFAIDRKGVLRVAGAERTQLDRIVDALVREGEAPVAGGEQAATEGAPGWPEIVEKSLYAKDYRGKQAPALAVTDWLTAQPQLKDKVVLYDFWATWCGPCRAGIPKLNKYQEKFAGDVVVVGISDEASKKVQSFMQATEIGYSMAVDTKGRMNRELGIQGIPHVLVVSSDGVVRWQGVPHMAPDELTEATLARIVAADKARRAQLER